MFLPDNCLHACDTSYLLGKGGYVFGSVGLSVCLFVCEEHYSKTYERIGIGRGVGGLSPPRLNIFIVGNMRVMNCFGQGGLRSLSASSFTIECNYR